MRVKNWDYHAGAEVEWTKTSRSDQDQHWIIEQNGDDFRITTRPYAEKNLCLDSFNEGRQGSRMGLWYCNWENENQLFQVIEKRDHPLSGRGQQFLLQSKSMGKHGTVIEGDHSKLVGKVFASWELQRGQDSQWMEFNFV